jgi:HrpA-like RNA helicase
MYHAKRVDISVLLRILQVEALTPAEEITSMGRLLSKLPTDVHLGKFLLFASIFKCLDPALTIAAALTSKSPFVTPFGHESAAASAKSSFRSGIYTHYLLDFPYFCDHRRLRFLDHPQRLCVLAASARKRAGCRPNAMQEEFPELSGMCIEPSMAFLRSHP